MVSENCFTHWQMVVHQDGPLWRMSIVSKLFLVCSRRAGLQERLWHAGRTFTTACCVPLAVAQGLGLIIEW